MLKILVGLSLANIGISIINYLQNRKIMSNQEKVEGMVERLNTATNEIASDLKAVRDEVKNLTGGAVSEATLDKLDLAIARAEALGADPADPVPDDVLPPVVDTTDESQG